MRRVELWLQALLLSTGAAACGADATTVEPAERYEPSSSCSLRSVAEWQGFLESAASHPEWMSTCSDLDDCDPRLTDFKAQVKSEIVDVLARCESDLRDYPPLARCSSRLRRFVPVWLRQHSSHRYGFDQANDAYFAAQVAPDKPEHLMQFPAELLAALPDLEALEQVARDEGFPYLIHDSGLGGTRIIFDLQEPGTDFERWFVMGFDTSTLRAADPSIVSFIGLETPSATHPRPRPHFRDYLVRAGEGGWSAELPTDFGGKCYACHPNGLRQLLPGAGVTTEAEPVRGEPDYGADVDPRQFGLQRLAAFNQRIASYGPPDWESSLNPADHGPPLGADLGCTTCHDGTTRGALSVMTSEGTLWQKLVGQLSMREPSRGVSVPDAPAMSLLERSMTGPPLSERETLALARGQAEHEEAFEKLMRSRPRDLARWLLEVGCE